MIYVVYVMYVLMLIASTVLIRRAWMERDSIGLTGGIIFVTVMFAAMLLTIKVQLEPEPIEIVERVNIIKYEFGEVGIKAFQDEDGTVFVVSCFQGEGDTVTACWDKRFVKDEDEKDE